MSAGLPLKADIAQRGWHGRKVPDSDINCQHLLQNQRLPGGGFAT
jgi:hypothetical protein